ncbi:MAG: DUF1445 domain-containing protein [Rhodospirillales bacterium]|jgi:uncharacterized protein YcsI (UPF0317 family)|nr:DUF1445 domain-containing protein [Rhodospirillales bacterium]
MNISTQKEAPDGALVRSDLERLSAAEVRAHIRAGRWPHTTKRLALGREQANLVILEERYAFDFMRFCLRNPKSLPLMEVTDPGDPEPKRVAPGADLRTDVPAYCLYREGRFVEEMSDIRDLWRPDHVAFLTGCNLSVDQVMLDAKIPLPHLVDEDARASQYISNMACEPAGIFAGPVVASMRPIPKELVVKVIEITSRYPQCHGGPIHVGDPAAIGIDDIGRADWGKANPIGPDQVPVFWACGVTAQAVAQASKIPEMITHASGHLFVTDLALLDPVK